MSSVQDENNRFAPPKAQVEDVSTQGGGLVRENAAWSYEEPYSSVGQIAGHVAFYPNKVDAIEEFTD